MVMWAVHVCIVLSHALISLGCGRLSQVAVKELTFSD